MGESIVFIAVIGLQERILYLGFSVCRLDFWRFWRPKESMFCFMFLQIDTINGPQSYGKRQDKCDRASCDATTRVDGGAKGGEVA